MSAKIIPFKMIMATILWLMTVDYSVQHGKMLEPPSRNSMWRAGFNTKPNYNDNELFCGGLTVQWKKNNGNCGICGDSYSIKPPRPYETGGKYATNIKVRKYKSGSMIKVIINISANHKGEFKFGLCPRQNPKQIETEECFITLKVNGHDTYKLESHRRGNVVLSVQLPPAITCKHCVFRWHWRGANNWGICPDGKGAVGCGPQETFRNCADIVIRNPKLRNRKLNQMPPLPSSIIINEIEDRRSKPRSNNKVEWLKRILKICSKSLLL